MPSIQTDDDGTPRQDGWRHLGCVRMRTGYFMELSALVGVGTPAAIGE